MAKLAVAAVLACALLPLPGAATPLSKHAALVEIARLESRRALVVGTFAQLLESRDREVALRAALGIGRTKSWAGIALLLPRTSDPDAAMRAMATYALGLIGGQTAAKAVLRVLQRDPSGAVQVAALDAVDRLETGRAFDAGSEREAALLTGARLQSSNRLIRARAATTLESFQKGAQAAACAQRLSRAFSRERDAYVRWHVMWSLFRVYAKRVPRAVLLAGLRDSDEIVRIETVRAWGRRGDKSAIALLQPLTADRSWRVQEQTLESIKVLQGGSATEHLKAIPNGVHVPAAQPDPFANIAALPRTPLRRMMRPHKPTPDAIITTNVHPRVRIVTTKGALYLVLYPEWAPLTVENFLNLANRGYYDNNAWFRIVPDFVVQTGDPTNSGNGDAGYTIPAEENPIEQDSYVISMGMNYTNPPNAHAVRDSAGTQFYITLSPQLHLDRDFTVFGRVVSGFDVLGRLIESDKIIRVERLPDARS